MTPQTFQNYLDQQEIEKGLRDVLLSVVEVFPQLAQLLKGSQQGYLATQNVYGEKQLAIDVQSNQLFLDALKKNPFVSSIASEELEQEEHGAFCGEEGGANWKAQREKRSGMASDLEKNQMYSVAFDPLDGSSLVDVNQAVGSIFGFYKGAGFLGKKGSEQVAALIVVYGPRLTFAFACGKGTVEFRYDEEAKDFVLSGALQLAEAKKMFAPGNLRASISEKWYLKLLDYWVLNGYTLRYSGGMVPDVNQILRKGGGIFTYPGYQEQPQGKLRLLYECAPMAFLIEQAGGSAVTFSASQEGQQKSSQPQRILDIVVEKLDQRTPIFLGSKKEVEKVGEIFAKTFN